MVKISGMKIYCERHKGWFFSNIYAREHKLPRMCPVCKRYDYAIIKVKK